MKRGKMLYPYPVIVGFFGQGEHVRMSFSQPVGKPWRFPAMVAMISEIVGNERERTRVNWTPRGAAPLPQGAPATDLQCYFVEWNGNVYRDEPAPSIGAIRRAKRAVIAATKNPARKRVVVFTGKSKVKAKPTRKQSRKPTRRAA